MKFTLPRTHRNTELAATAADGTRRARLGCSGKKSLLSVATLSALALLSGSASAYSLQYDGFGKLPDVQDPDANSHVTFIGANVVNNGPSYSNFKDRFGDHWADDSNPGKYNTTGDVNLTYTQDIFDNVLADDSMAEPEYFDIFGAGLVYGSTGISADHDQAKLDGNVSILLKDIRLTEADGSGKPGVSVFGAGGTQGAVGDASMTGNITIVLENVYSHDSDVSGGGETNGTSDPMAPTMDTSIDVTGDISITLKNSTIAYVTGGSSIEGDARPGHEASVTTGNIRGDITINLVDSHLVGTVFDTDEDDYFPYSVLIGGSDVTDNGIADVTGTVSVNFANSDADFILGGGLMTESDVNASGKSATVGGVRMTFDNSAVRETLVAGGVTDFTVFSDNEDAPVGGDARVKGDVNIVLKNGTTVNTVYMSGYGVGADVTGDSTLVIADSSVKVTEGGVLYGQGKVVNNAYEGSTQGTSTLAFGLDDTAYVGDFSAAFRDFDVVTATKGSTVDLGTVDATKHGRIGADGRSALTFSGEGTFRADVDLAGAHDVTVATAFEADRVSLSQGATLTVDNTGALTTGVSKFNNDSELLLGGNMTVNGTFTLLGNIDGVEGADSKTVLGNLVLTQGGTIGAASSAGSLDLTANLAKLAVSGDLTAQNATINADEFTLENGTLDNLSAEINGTKATLGNGAKLVNKGGFHYDTIVLGAGSTYLEEEDEFFDAEGYLGFELAADEGTLEFAGGKLGAIGAESKELKQIRFVDEAENQSSNSDLTLARFSANSSYALDDVTFAQQKEDRLSSLEVTGGAKLDVKSFAAGNGQAFVKEGGALEIDTLTSTGNFAMTVHDTGLLTIDTFVGVEGGHFTLAEGTADIGSIDLTKGVLEVGANGTLKTTTGQVFTIALKADGTNVAEANALKYSADSLLFTEGGSLALSDAKYNRDYADTATNVFKDTYKNGTIAFTGELVDASGNVEESVGISDINDGQIFEKTDVTAEADKQGSVVVDKTVGGRTLKLGEGVEAVEVKNGKTLTLVGSADGGELVAFKGDKAPVLNVAGGLALGSADNADVKGSITVAIDLSGEEGLTVKNGSFELADLTVSGNTKLDAGTTGKLGVTTLTLKSDLAVSGDVTVDELSASEDSAVGISNGNLTVAKGSLKKVAVTVGTPATAYAAANETPAASSTDATTFAFGGKTVEGSITANANGIVAIGTTDLTAFHSVFSEGFGTWSTDTSAAFVAGPVTVEKTGSLHVGASNAQVAFGANSVLVADITGMAEDDTLITAESFSVAKESVAYLVGSVKDGVATFNLTSEKAADHWNTVKSGSAMLEVAFDDEGKLTVANVNAAEAYGNLMQGHALADAGYRSQGAERDYAQALLTDTTGLSNAAVAARFDAAMNPGGSLAVFTTAYDRASDLRRVVRDEATAASTESRLWARVTGGMTKLDGISTGAQALDVETDAYGLAVGAESMLGDWKLGGAFTAGTGDTDNDDVAAKDEFDFYGLSFYGKKSIGAYDVFFDATAAWVKSDLKVNGVADLTTDTTTSVYGLGAEVRRTVDLGAVKFTPFVGANLYYVTSDGYTTNHGVRVDDADATAVEFPIGAELSAAFDTAGGMRLAPAFSLAVVPTAGDTEVDQTVAFAGATSSYRFTFADDVKVRSNLALTAETGDFAFGLKAGYEWGDEERGATTFSLNAAYRF